MKPYDELASALTNAEPAGGSISFASPGYRTVPFSKGNFKTIRASSTVKRIAYVDGGDSCIFDSSDSSAHLIRVVALVTEPGKRTGIRKTEFFTSINALGTDGSIKYVARSYPRIGRAPGQISCDSMDNRLKQGVDRAAIGKLAQIVRRTAELSLACDVCKELDEGDLLILDGTLEARFASEQEALESLLTVIRARNILLAGISKASDILTDEGRSVTDMLFKEGPDSAWFYHPAAESTLHTHPVLIAFAKLHTKSRHVLRIELEQEQARLTDLDRFFSVLAGASKDLSLPGYPYGLIKADRLARVQNSEARHARIMLLSRRPELEARGIHEILDSMG